MWRRGHVHHVTEKRAALRRRRSHPHAPCRGDSEKRQEDDLIGGSHSCACFPLGIDAMIAAPKRNVKTPDASWRNPVATFGPQVTPNSAVRESLTMFASRAM